MLVAGVLGAAAGVLASRLAARRARGGGGKDAHAAGIKVHPLARPCPPPHTRNSPLHRSSLHAALTEAAFAARERGRGAGGRGIARDAGVLFVARSLLLCAARRAPSPLVPPCPP